MQAVEQIQFGFDGAVSQSQVKMVLLSWDMFKNYGNINKNNIKSTSKSLLLNWIQYV